MQQWPRTKERTALNYCQTVEYAYREHWKIPPHIPLAGVSEFVMEWDYLAHRYRADLDAARSPNFFVDVVPKAEMEAEVDEMGATLRALIAKRTAEAEQKKAGAAALVPPPTPVPLTPDEAMALLP